MTTDDAPPKATGLRPDARSHANPDAKDDLKTLPLAEVEKKLGSSPDGLTSSRGAKAAGPIWAQRDRGKENQSVPEIPHLFLGTHPVDDRSSGDSVGRGRALAGFLHHPAFAGCQRRGRILGRTPGGQRHRCAQGQAGDQGASEARWEVDQPAGARAGAGRRHPHAPGRHRAGGCAPAGRRPGRGGSVRADGRVVARHAQTRRGGVFRFDHSPGRNRRTGLCHRHEHLLRQDRATGARRAHRQPFSKGRAEDRQLPDHPRGGSGGGDYRRRDSSRRPDTHDAAVRPGADRGRDSRGDADGACR